MSLDHKIEKFYDKARLTNDRRRVYLSKTYKLLTQLASFVEDTSYSQSLLQSRYRKSDELLGCPTANRSLPQSNYLKTNETVRVLNDSLEVGLRELGSALSQPSEKTLDPWYLDALVDHQLQCQALYELLCAQLKTVDSPTTQEEK